MLNYKYYNEMDLEEIVDTIELLERQRSRITKRGRLSIEEDLLLYEVDYELEYLYKLYDSYEDSDEY